MSSPWAFVGTWFPMYEDSISSGSIGDGTLYPVTWGRTNGATTSNQMCRFEWMAKSVRRQIAGTVTLDIYDPSGSGMHQLTPAAFSFDDSVTPVPGTDWSVVEPSDLLLGGRAFQFSLPATIVVPVVLPWGSDNINISLADNGGGSGDSVTGLWSINGSSFAQYVKAISNLVTATNDNPGGPPFTMTELQASTNAGLFGSFAAPAGFTATLFHGTGTVSQGGDNQANASSWSFTTFSYAVTAEYAQPPNI